MVAGGMLVWVMLNAGCGASRPVTLPETAPIERVASTAEPPVRVLLARTEFQIEEDGRYTSKFHQRYRVLNQQGIETWSSTQQFWAPWYLAKPDIEVTVTSPAGAVTRLDPRALSESAAYPDAPDIYGDARYLRGPIPSVTIGSVVDETIVTKATRPFFLGGSTQYVLLQVGVPRDQVEVVVDVPENVPFRYELRDARMKVEETKNGKRRHLVVRGGPFPGIQTPEALVPSDVPQWPYLAFSTAPGWEELARAYDTVMQTRLSDLRLPADLQRAVDAKHSVPDKANVLLQWMRDRVRYAGIEFGESAIVPFAPAVTLERGYGDCKDQAMLLVGLLRAAGIGARLALLRAGSDEDVRPSLPGLNVFNHAIVVVPSEKPLWIDPTVRHALAGELPTEDEDRWALVIDGSTKSLTRTPVSSMADNAYEETRNVQLVDNGPGKVIEITTATGAVERRLRESFSGSRADLSKFLQKYIKTTYNTERPVAFEISPVDDLSKRFSLRVDAERAKVAVTDATSADVLLDPSSVLSWLPNVLKAEEPRKSDLVIPVLHRARVKYEIRAPEGFVPTAIPELKDTMLGPVLLRRSVRAQGNVVVASFETEVSKRNFRPADVAAFREALQKLDRESSIHIRFLHEGRQQIEKQQLEKGLALYRKYADNNPKSGTHQARLAFALANLGFGSAARVVAARAVELAPQEPFVHRIRALVLSTDELGRDFHAGYDRKGAIAECRRTLELDDSDMSARMQLALLLEHDEKGKRYASSDLMDAVAEYDRVPPEQLESYANGSFVSNALFTLLWANRFEEVTKRVKSLPLDKVPSEVAITAVAALEGANGGLTEAQRLQLSGETRTRALESAAETLLQLGRYLEAGGLFDAASIGAPNATYLQTRSQMAKKLRHVDPAALPARSPTDVLLKAYTFFGENPDADVGAARSLVAARSWVRDGKSQVEDIFRSIGRARDPSSSRRLFVDILGTSLQAVASGDDDVGYRLEARTETAGSAAQFQAFVVKDSGGYRVRAFSDDPSELGAEAFYAAQHGKMARARKWLDWARDLIRAGAGEDPLRVLPFARLWASDKKGDPVVAAAALCAQGQHASECIPTLEQARNRTSDPEALHVLEQALAIGYAETEQYREGLEMGRKLRIAYPTSDFARDFVLQALWESGRFEDYRSEVAGALKVKPTDTQLMELRINAEEQLGRFEEAMRLADQFDASGKGHERFYNNAAWLSLFTRRVRDVDLGRALKSVQATNGREPKSLHTLAAVYLELGRNADARRVLADLLALRREGEPATEDWYIIGRLAENLSLRDAAKAAYAHVEAPKHPHLTSTWALAQRRSKGLK